MVRVFLSYFSLFLSALRRLLFLLFVFLGGSCWTLRRLRLLEFTLIKYCGVDFRFLIWAIDTSSFSFMCWIWLFWLREINLDHGTQNKAQGPWGWDHYSQFWTCSKLDRSWFFIFVVLGSSKQRGVSIWGFLCEAGWSSKILSKRVCTIASIS